jgi:serine/threonine-protein phosphatase 2A activator
MAEAKGYDPLELVVRGTCHEFILPRKCIHDGNDVSFWLSSKAYRDIMKFLLQLNLSMFPQKSSGLDVEIQHWTLSAENVEFSRPVLELKELMGELEKIIEEAPPDTGPRRFGNVSFRKWYQIVESRADALLMKHLPLQVVNFPTTADVVTPLDELKEYFMASFGSAPRLDYGSGHELSFLAFIGCIWKLGGFEKTTPGAEERGIVLGIIEPCVPQ